MRGITSLLSTIFTILIIIGGIFGFYLLFDYLTNKETQKQLNNIIMECKLKGMNITKIERGDGVIFVLCKGSNKECLYKINRVMLDIYVTSECSEHYTNIIIK